MNDRLTETTIGDIVATDFRTAAVFDRFHIDFCCGGRRPFAEACREADAEPDAVREALAALPPSTDESLDASRWPLDRLIDHIVSTHHAYVRAALPAIGHYLAKLIQVHGSRHPELSDVGAAFETISRDLAAHMMKEELVLFPYVRALAENVEAGGPLSCPFGTVENPIRMMEREHQDAADEMRLIRDLTLDYTAPSDGCTSYAVCMLELKRFEDDLHRHVHLENNVLFPRAIALERGGAN